MLRQPVESALDRPVKPGDDKVGRSFLKSESRETGESPAPYSAISAGTVTGPANGRYSIAIMQIAATASIAAAAPKT